MSVREFSDGADDWMDSGACREPGVDPEWFFSQSHAAIDRAKQVCAGCDHTARCHAYAVENREVGVWGGADDLDRRRARMKGLVRSSTCRKGHPMTPENTHYRADGGRRCKECWRKYYRSRRADEKTGLHLVRGGEE